MENEAGAQIAYFSNPFPPGGYNGQARNAGWNVNSWDWDGVRFVAKPVGGNGHGREISHVRNAEASSRSLHDTANPSAENNKRKYSSEEEDAGNLTLKLGGSSYGDDNSSKNNKRFRSGSTATSYPACQVDNCRTDLTGAKDYHRRHKVCEPHSKASKILVGNIMQRFCQQCSRFHPLEEFDEGKRSCRRRLAGHNKRRRKTQSGETGCRGLLSGEVNGALRNLDIAALINVLSQQLQANDSMDKLLGRMVSNEDYLVQCLSKLKSMTSSEDLSRNNTQTDRVIDLNISQDTQPQREDTKAQVVQTNGVQPPVLNLETVRILSTLIQRSPEALSLLHRALMGQQTANCQSHGDRHRINNQSLGMKPTVFASEIMNGTAGPGVRDKLAENSASRGCQGFPFHLFDSLENTGRPNHMTLKETLTDCNSADERLSSRSPSADERLSPPAEQKLFPLHSSDESKDNDSVSVGEETDLTPDESPNNDGHCKITLPSCGKSSDLLHFPLRSVHGGSDLRINSYTSSGSDQSPASSNSDTQDRTSRIIFKLCDKDPSDFPQMLRTQILEWLSHIPSDMESYIRPGCVILTVFASMPSAAWDQLRVDLQERMKFLLSKDCGYNFWKNGRIMVQVERKFASLKDGQIQCCRSCRSLSAPKILTVQPIAVVAGEETRLILRGENLMAPGTKILCAYRGKYISEKIIPDDHHVCGGTLLNKSATIVQKFPGGPANVLGRCFVEVERGLQGNSFPVIVADSAICRELRSLEGDIQGLCEDKVRESHSRMNSQGDDFQSSTQENVISFLNELGWLFQTNSYTGKKPLSSGVLPARFKFLLTYAVERDWNSLLKRVLDILLCMCGEEGSIQEALDVVSEIYLLHRAVKRNCRQVVDLLLCYKPLSSANGNFAFSPDVIGPGGLTPLHLAASMQNAEDIVDALTSDPQKIGLQAWTTALDANHQTPHAYALMRNNHSYNWLVERKLADSLSTQVSITILREFSLNESATQGIDGLQCVGTKLSPPIQKLARNCGECARLGCKRASRSIGYHGATYRPFVYSLLSIAAVCVCVCLLFKGPPTINSIAPFMWETIGYGSY